MRKTMKGDDSSVEWSSWGGGNGKQRKRRKEKVRNQFPWISSLDSDIRMRFSSLCLRPHHHQWQWALKPSFLLVFLFGREEDGESFVLMRLETRWWMGSMKLWSEILSSHKRFMTQKAELSKYNVEIWNIHMPDFVNFDWNKQKSRE